MPQKKSTTTYMKGTQRRKVSKSSRIKLMPIRKAAKGAAEEGKQESLGRMSVKRLDSSEAAARAEPKAEKLTRLMRKGYRKGYRVKSTRGGSRR